MPTVITAAVHEKGPKRGREVEKLAGSGWPQAQCNSLTIMKNFRQLGRILH